jgi:hypothetical protein
VSARRGGTPADAARVVLSALRRRVDDGRFGVDAAVETAFVHLVRPGGPGERLGPADRAALRDTLAKLARPLQSTGPMPRALLAFARDAVDAALALLRAPPGGRHRTADRLQHRTAGARRPVGRVHPRS